jgi:hypothetical protein
MLSLLKKIFGSKPADTANEAPYKVEVPATPVAEKATEAVVESIAKPVKKAAPKKPAAKKGPRKPKQSKPKA